MATDAGNQAQTSGVRLLHILLMFALVCSAAFAGELVELRRSGDHIEVLVGGRTFTAYYFGSDVAKPYLFPLNSAEGTVVTRSFPMVSGIPGEDRDEPHQRAMYFAHGDVSSRLGSRIGVRLVDKGGHNPWQRN